MSPSSEGGREGQNALMQNRDMDGEGLGTVRRDKGWGAETWGKEGSGERREEAKLERVGCKVK